MNTTFLNNWFLFYVPDEQLGVSAEHYFDFFVCPTAPAVQLFGHTCGDSRHEPVTGMFADGHRIQTSPLVSFSKTEAKTLGTVYTLGEMHPAYAKWLAERAYVLSDTPITFSRNKENGSGITVSLAVGADTVLRHICENCGKTEDLTSAEGFDKGWDYPPRMGRFGIVSPRTCGSCSVDTTLWWQLEALKVPYAQLSTKHKATLERILSEPASILVSVE